MDLIWKKLFNILFNLAVMLWACAPDGRKDGRKGFLMMPWPCEHGTDDKSPAGRVTKGVQLWVNTPFAITMSNTNRLSNLAATHKI